MNNDGNGANIKFYPKVVFVRDLRMTFLFHLNALL